MAKTVENWVEHYKNLWLTKAVPAAVDLWLTEELTGPDNNAPYGRKINNYADHPTYGFLKRGKHLRPWSARTETTEDPSDYVGFINSDQYSQLDAKINSLHSGTGTKKAKDCTDAFEDFWEKNGRGAYYLALGMMTTVGMDDYLPLYNQSTSLGGSPQMTGRDVQYAICLWGNSGGGYNYASSAGGQARWGYYLGGGAAFNRGIILLKPEMQGNPKKFDWATLDVAEFNALKLNWSTYLNSLGNVTSDKSKLKDRFKDYPTNAVFEVDRRGRISDRNIGPFIEGFVATVARNFPHLVSERVHAIIDDIIKDMENTPGTDTGDNPALVAEGGDAARPAEGREVSIGSKDIARYGGFLKPFDLQCFLMENINFISEIKDGADNYQYLARINQGRGNPGNLVSLIQHGGRDGQVQALLETCPDAYALLSPSIRIFRVDYEGDKILQPYREVEIPFPNFTNPADIELIGEGLLGRVPGAGIKSFTWSLDGVNPAEVDNNISANLSLYFQSIQDLFALNRDDKGEYKLQAGLEQPTYLDLIIGSGTSFRQTPVKNKAPVPRNANICDTVTEAYEGERFRIKALVGWSAPTDINTIINATGMNEAQATAWKEAIETSSTALYLQVTRHQLNFKDDGSVELSIDYQASLSGIMRARNADIFEGDTVYTEDLEKAEEKHDEESAAAKKAKDASFSADNGSVETDGDESEVEKAKEKVDEFAEKDRMAKYRRFLTILYDSNKIYTIKVNSATYQQGLISREKDPQKRAQMAKTRSSSEPAARGFGAPQQSESFDDSLLRNLATFSATSGDAPGNALEGPDEFEQYAEIQLEKDDDGSIDVPYFYLGDLINGILEYLKHLPADKKGNGSLQMMLGTVEMMDPLMAFQVDKLELFCSGTKAKKVLRAIAEVDPMRFAGTGLSKLLFSTNIGSIPISLTYFQEWYVNRVIRPQRRGYSLLAFVKDVSSSLIGKAFNSICFESALQYSLKFDVATFNLGRSYTGATTLPRFVARNKKRGDDLARQKLGPNVEPHRRVIPTLILYSVNSKPRTGDYDTDLKNGIYHYFMGGSCGLNKTIKFNRMDQPYLREARISRKGNLSAMQLRELYTVTMDMIGNTLHKNGQYIYVEPIGVGIGDRKAKGSVPNLARILGIGGYHMVTKVSHTISDAGFQVSLEALQEGMSFADHRIVGLTYHNTDEEQSPKDNPAEEKPQEKKAKSAEEKRWDAEFGPGSYARAFPDEAAGAN